MCDCSCIAVRLCWVHNLQFGLFRGNMLVNKVLYHLHLGTAEYALIVSQFYCNAASAECGENCFKCSLSYTGY